MNANLAYKEDFRREELIGGKIVMMSPAAVRHTLVSGNIYVIFWSYLRGKKCTPISGGVIAYLTDEDHFVPDMMVVCDPEKIGRTAVYGAPDLVVEVLSPSTARNDRGRKMQVYGQCGVREYWIISPGDRTIEQYFLQDGALALHDVYHAYAEDMLAVMTEEERAALVTHFQCSLFDDLLIRVDDVFERVW